MPTFTRSSTMIARLLLALLCFATAADPVVQVAPDVESGVYEPGKPVTWAIQVKAGDAAGTGKVTYVVRPGGAGESAKGEAELVDGKATVKATRETPGTLLVEVHYKPEGAKDIV